MTKKEPAAAAKVAAAKPAAAKVAKVHRSLESPISRIPNLSTCSLLCLLQKKRGRRRQMCLKHGDFVTVLSSLATRQDLILIDPPTGCSSKNHNEKDDYDKALWKNWDEVAHACKRKLQPTGSVVVMPGAQQGAESQSVYRDATAAFKGADFRMASFIWEKFNEGWPYNGLLNIHKHKPKACTEPLLVFSTQTDTMYKQIGQTDDKIVALQHKRHHLGIKHLKPLKLYDQLLSMFCKPNAAVCDGTLYTGIAAVAAFRRGLRFTGIEIRDKYLRQASRRIATASKVAKRVVRRLARRLVRDCGVDEAQLLQASSGGSCKEQIGFLTDRLCEELNKKHAASK